MSMKKAWNKVNTALEKANNSIWGIFSPDKLHQIAGGWSLQHMKEYFNKKTHNRSEPLYKLALVYNACSYNPQDYQPEYSGPQNTLF